MQVKTLQEYEGIPSGAYLNDANLFDGNFHGFWVSQWGSYNIAIPEALCRVEEARNPTQEVTALSTENASLRRRSGDINSKDPLVDFLYHLMRDHVPAGVVEGILQKQVFASETIESEYCNGYLAKYAQDIATRLQG